MGAEKEASSGQCVWKQCKRATDSHFHQSDLAAYEITSETWSRIYLQRSTSRVFYCHRTTRWPPDRPLLSTLWLSIFAFSSMKSIRRRLTSDSDEMKSPDGLILFPLLVLLAASASVPRLSPLISCLFLGKNNKTVGKPGPGRSNEFHAFFVDLVPKTPPINVKYVRAKLNETLTNFNDLQLDIKQQFALI